MKHTVLNFAKITSAIAMLMLASACSPSSATTNDAGYYPASSLNSSGSWSASNATARGTGYYYEYDGI